MQEVDYSSFSWESIQKDFRDMVADVQRETGATDEQIAMALSVCAEKFMDVNGFELTGGAV